MNTGKRLNGSNGDTRIAALHQSGGHVCAVLAQPQGSSIVIHDCASVRSADLTSLRQRLESWKPDAIVGVLPGGCVVSRIIEVPSMPDPEAQIQAAMLQAEAELPPFLPEHRTSVAMLPWNTTTDARAGLALGWIGQAPEMPVVGDPPVPVSFTAQAACLAELLIAANADGMIAFASRASGSLELVGKMAQTVNVRTARIDPDDWTTALERVLIETALAGGAGDQTIDSIQRAAAQAVSEKDALISDPDVAARLGARINGAKKDAAWWNQYGLCVGAALGACSRRADNFALLGDAPPEPHGFFYNAANWLAVPRNNIRLLVASIILIVLLPFVSAWLRYSIVSLKARHLEDVRKNADQQVATADFYAVLNKQRWPMTKLLADLATMAWYNLDFDSVYIDSNSNITLSGDAPLSDGEKILAFHRNLEKSPVFGAIRQSSKAGESKIDFDFQIWVSNPLADSKRVYTDPLGSVMYGSDYDGVQPGGYFFNAFAKGRTNRVLYPPDGSIGADGGNEPENFGNETPDSGPDGFTIGDLGSDEGSESNSGVVSAPPPSRRSNTPGRTFDNGGMRNSAPTGIPIGQLTDEQIAKLDLTAVVKAMTERGRVKDRDPVAKAEYDKLVNRYQELRSRQGGGGSSPAGGDN